MIRSIFMIGSEKLRFITIWVETISIMFTYINVVVITIKA